LKQVPKHYRKTTPYTDVKFKDDFALFTGGRGNIDVGLIGLVDFNENGKYDILIAFRGTVGVLDWINDCKERLVDSPYSKGKVHKGFLDSIIHLEGPMYNKLNELLNEHPEATIYITGHSKGGALATLMGQRILKDKKDFKDRIRIVTFGSPRVGDNDFRSDYNLEHYRYESFWDIVPHLPFSEQECLLCAKLTTFFEKHHILGDFIKLPHYIHVGEGRVFKRDKKRSFENFKAKIDLELPIEDDEMNEELKSFQSLLSAIHLNTLLQIIDVHIFDYDDIPDDL